MAHMYTTAEHFSLATRNPVTFLYYTQLGLHDHTNHELKSYEYETRYRMMHMHARTYETQHRRSSVSFRDL